MDLVFEIPNHLNHEICKNIIERFQSCNKKSVSRTDNDDINMNIRDSVEISISRYIEWEDVADILDKSLKDGIEQYKNFLKTKFDPVDINILNNLEIIDGYVVNKSGKHEWHSDARVINGKNRCLTFTWYLNTRNFDGERDFIYKKVKAETGKLVISPSTWEYIYKDNKAVDKFTVVAFLFSKSF